MAGELSLKTPLTGLVTLVPTNTATDKTITLPATTGTMVVQDGTNTTTITNLAYTGTLTGGTGVVNLGSGQVYKDVLGQLGIGTASPGYRLDVAAGDTTANFGYAMRLRSNATATAATLQFTNSGVTTENGYIRVTDTGLMSLSNKAYITSAGNVGIGTSSPNQRLQVTGSNSTGFAGATLQNSNANVGLAGVQFSSDTTYSKSAIAQVRENPNGAGPLVFYVDSATDAADWSAGDEKMRISAAGNVGIGTGSPAAKLTSNVSGAGSVTALNLTNDNSGFAAGTGTAINFGVASSSTIGAFGKIEVLNQTATSGSNAYMAFSTRSGDVLAEKMRISAAGNVLVGTTSSSDNTNGAKLEPSTTAGAPTVLKIMKTVSGGVNGILNYHSGTYVGGINFDNTSTSFPTSSDIRLKKDIVDAPSALLKVRDIRIVSHGWKHDDGVVEFGVIAQELVSVAPSAVTQGDDGEKVVTTWSVDYSKLVPILTKAIQELTARLEVLENK